MYRPTAIVQTTPLALILAWTIAAFACQARNVGSDDARSCDASVVDVSVGLDTRDAPSGTDASDDVFSPSDAADAGQIWRTPIGFGHADTDLAKLDDAPQAVVSASGDGFVIFHDETHTVWARRYLSATNAFDSLFQISDTSSPGIESRVAVDDAGNAIVVWADRAGAGKIYARRFLIDGVGEAAPGAAGSWRAIETVQTPVASTVSFSALDVAMTPDGSVAVSWIASDLGGATPTSSAYLKIFEAGGSWAASERIGAGISCDKPRVAIAHVSNSLQIVAAWNEDTPGAEKTFTTRYVYDLTTHAGAFSSAPISLLTDATLHGAVWGAGIDVAGNAFVATSESDNTATGKRNIVINHFADGTWVTPTVVSTTNGVDAPSLSVGRTEGAVVLWRQCAPCALWGRRFDQGIWQPVEQISATDATVGNNLVALNNSGYALAIWSRNVDGAPRVMAAEFDPAKGWWPQHLIDQDGTAASLALGTNGVGLAAWTRRTVDASATILRSRIAGAVFR
jgi:dipeptidyl aminopeptidase/acylaminoacyl peptidase